MIDAPKGRVLRVPCALRSDRPKPSAPPTAYLPASTEHAGHPVAARTAACGGRLGGGPAHDDTLPASPVPRNRSVTCRHATSRARRHSAHSTACRAVWLYAPGLLNLVQSPQVTPARSEEHTSELQSRRDLVCRLLLEKKKKKNIKYSDMIKEVLLSVEHIITV